MLNLKLVTGNAVSLALDPCQMGRGNGSKSSSSLALYGAMSKSAGGSGGSGGSGGRTGGQSAAREKRFGANAERIQKLQTLAKNAGATSGERKAALGRIAALSKKSSRGTGSSTVKVSSALAGILSPAAPRALYAGKGAGRKTKSGRPAKSSKK